jgi:hypothetical protein
MENGFWGRSKHVSIAWKDVPAPNQVCPSFAEQLKSSEVEKQPFPLFNLSTFQPFNRLLAGLRGGRGWRRLGGP